MERIKVKYVGFLFSFFVLSEATLFLLYKLFEKSIGANIRTVGEGKPFPKLYDAFDSVLEISWIAPLVIVVACSIFSDKLCRRIENLVFLTALLNLLFLFVSVLVVFLSGYIWTRHWVQH